MSETVTMRSNMKSLECRHQTHEKCPGYVLAGVGVNQVRQPCTCTCHGIGAT